MRTRKHSARRLNLAVETLEQRDCPAAGLGETYAWYLINTMRADPAAFADEVDALYRGTRVAFGISPSEPFAAEVKAFINAGPNRSNFDRALALMRSTPALGSLAYDNTLELGAETHTSWMKNNAFVHTENYVASNAVTYLPGFTTQYQGETTDSYSYAQGAFQSWGENIAFFTGATSANVSGNILLQRQVMLATLGMVTEIRSGNFGDLKNLLASDTPGPLTGVKSTDSEITSSFNSIGIDLDINGSTVIVTHRLGFKPLNGAGGILSGIAYADLDGDKFFDIGEQITVSGYEIVGTSLSTGTVASTTGMFLNQQVTANGAYTVGIQTSNVILGRSKPLSINANNGWVEFRMFPSIGLTGGQSTAVFAADQYEENDTSAAATNLGVVRPGYVFGRAAEGFSIDTTSDADWYKFQLDGPATSGSRITIGFEHSSGDLDAGLFRLNSSTGQLENMASSTSTNDSESFDLSTYGAGTYFLHVFGYLGQHRNFYAVSFDVGSKATATTPKMVGPTGTLMDLRPTLSWVPVANAVGYNIWVSGGGQLIQEAPSGATWQPSVDLTPGSSYTYYVQAKFANNAVGPWSGAGSFTIATAAPRSYPQPLSSLQPTLTWDAVANADKYVIYLSNLTTGQSDLFPNATVNAGSTYEQSWTPPTALAPGYTYGWYVRALNGTNAGAWSALSTFTIAPKLANLGTVNDLKPTLQWSAITGVSRYEVWLANSTTGVARVINASTNSLAVDVQSGFGYTWYVRPLNSAGNGGWSTAATFSVAVPTLQKVGNLASDLRQQVELANGIANATASEFWLSNVTSGEVRTGAITDSTIDFSDLVSGHSYVVYVRMNGSAGQGNWSAPLGFTVATVALSNSGVQTSLRPTLSWSRPSNATSQEIWLQDLTSGGVSTFSVSASASSFSPSADLVSGRSYRWYHRALNSKGQGAWGAPATFSILRPTPTTTGVQNSLRPTLNISNSIGTIQVYLVDTSTGVVTQFAGSSGSAQVPTDLVSGRSYRYFARVLNDKGLGEWSAPATFSIAVPTSASLSRSGELSLGFSWSLSLSSANDIYLENVTTGAVTLFRSAFQGFSTTNVRPGDSYRFYVRSVNSRGEAGAWSSVSNTVSFPNVTGLNVSSSSSLTPFFGSSNYLNISTISYDLYLSNLDTGAVTQQRYSGGTGQRMPALVSGNRYAWYLRIVNGTLLGDWVAGPNFTALLPTLDSFPSETSNTQPTLGWNSLDGATGYDVHFQNLTTGAVIVNTQRQTSPPFMPASPLTRTHSYRLWIRAVSTAGVGAWVAGSPFKVV